MKQFIIFLLVISMGSGLLIAEEVECEIQDLKCVKSKIKGNSYIDLQRKDSAGKTSLHYAVESRNIELIESILNTNIGTLDLEDKLGISPLQRAVTLNYKEGVEVLLRFNPFLDKVDRNGETILDIANANGYTELAIILNSKGATDKSKNKSNTVILVYGVYIFLSILITVWVARTLSKNGRIFLVDAFQRQELADSVNHLLVVGFYLINFGYITIALKIGLKPIDAVEALEVLSMKIGLVILILGFMHFFNLYLFGRLRKRTLLKKELGIVENVAVVKPVS